MQVKTASEAFRLFDRWRSSETLLRVSFRTPFLLLDVESKVDRVESPLIGLQFEDCGFTEFLFDTKWRFDFAALDALRARPEDRLGRSSLNTRAYEFGEMISAIRTGRSRWTMTFYEIVKRLG